ncbi:MAG: S8 family peptidase [FCB group bacterium]|nr:S8 family peptidase [FCB group bacterium]
MKKAIQFLILSAALISVSHSQTIDPAFQNQLEQLVPDETLPAWIFFHDRGLTAQEIPAALDEIRDLLPERTRLRRERGGMPNLYERDLPVNTGYAAQIENITGDFRAVTKYFNGVSADLTLEQTLEILALPFVKEIRPVARMKRSLPPVKSTPEYRAADLDYGESYGQLNQIEVPLLHDMGFSGEGILICLLDTGFRLDHAAFDSVDVVDQWDFINNDPIVGNEPGDPDDQQWHGTATLSVCGGYVPGELIGPAYGASFIAGKTEMTDQEIPIEEDYFVAGLEWADSLGADIVSSSLGYYDWYVFDQLDGNTTVTAIGMDIAASHGILCVTAAGNERNNSQWPYIITPADADSVVTCGAVNVFGELAGFSSPGPTADGRIKPEVCAQGVDVHMANANNPNGFTNANGTSFSTPLTAGAAALILEAHPNWAPMTVREALMMTADNAANPDNDYGWGIIGAYQAAYYSYPPVIETVEPSGDTVFVIIDSTAAFTVTASDEDGDPLTYYFEIDGQAAEENETGLFDFTPLTADTFTLTVEVSDLIGFEDNAAVTIIAQQNTSIEESNPALPEKFNLTVYPNPFNAKANISFCLDRESNIDLTVFDISGREVESLATGHLSPGEHEAVWEAEGVSSGLYLLRIQYQGGVEVEKLMLLK